VQRHAWNSVLTDGSSSLLLGKEVLRLTTPQSCLFPVEPLRGYVLARVPCGNRINVIRLTWLSIRRGNRINQLLLAGMIAFLLTQLISLDNPAFLQALRTYLRQ
jgi:hypothetical protein